MSDDLDPERDPQARPDAADSSPRPWLERIGLAGIAVVMSLLFAAIALAAWTGGEWILAAMSAGGALVTIAVGLSTLVRG